MSTKPDFPRFVIEDEFHSDWVAEFDTEADAMTELRRRAALPYLSPENRCPCVGWRHCHREYILWKFDDEHPQGEQQALHVIIDESGTQWLDAAPSPRR